MGKAVSKVTDAVGLTNYGDQAKAGKRAANQQLAATNAQIAMQERADIRQAERLQPFVNLGLDNIPGLQSLMTSQGQADWLATNPMFQAAVDDASTTMTTAGASRGKLNSGGMVDQLFKNYMAMGDQFVGNQFNRLLQPIGMGQASAAGQAANSLNAANNITGILGNQGDIRAAGTMAGQNIQNQALGGGLQMLQGGLMGSGLLGGGGLAGGGMAGAGLGALFFSDERLKEVGERIGETDDGIPIYKWRYKGDTQMHIGPMAQDVEAVNPAAVLTHNSGYKVLNLEAL